MGRFIVLIAVVVALAWLVRRALRAQAKGDSSAAAAGGRAEPPASQELVRCARCALLLPRGEARMSAGAIYCSEEHARLGAGAGPRSG